MENYFSNDQYHNRDYVIFLENDLFEIAKKEKNKKWLHLGCGGRVLDGFINVDKYVEHPEVFNFDIYKLPYEDNSVDLIYCSHVLEHLPYRHSKMAMSEWGRVLKKESKLFLAIPDLDLIMIKMLDPTISHETWEWYLHTLFGFQTNPSNLNSDVLDYPLDLGQFHTCGFNKKTISQELQKINFEIVEMFNYDGWDTPSIWVTAVKK